MGIKVEFNPDLALRHISEHKNGNRKIEECLPEELKVGQVYDFLKEGQRNYWLEGEILLLETKGNQLLSKPIASILILKSTHFLKNNIPFTKGKYKVVKLISDDEIYFNAFSTIKQLS